MPVELPLGFWHGLSPFELFTLKRIASSYSVLKILFFLLDESAATSSHTSVLPYFSYRFDC
jgi:hypothetical protein